MLPDSLHRVYEGAGLAGRHIVAIDRAATNASNIHIVRLTIFWSLAPTAFDYMVRKIILINACFSYSGATE